jgi:vacuolar-type H+-ATPase subunit E/Vma4
VNGFDGIVGRQVETLTGVLRERTNERCREIRQEAKQRADALLSQSRREARTRVHEAVLEERRRRERAIVEARHRLDSEARRQLQGRYKNLTDLAWPLLNRELTARWTRPGSRAEWCELLVDEAAQLLGKDDWLVQHPSPDRGAWSRDDQERLQELLAAHDIPTPELQPDTALEAGLRIRRHGACLDGTIGGLLARHAAVTARLLAHWEIEASRNRRTQEGSHG